MAVKETAVQISSKMFLGGRPAGRPGGHCRSTARDCGLDALAGERARPVVKPSTLPESAK